VTTFRCAIYTRKSSEEGLEQGFNSLHAQREACEAYVFSQAGEGWKALATIYDDGGFSGGNMERPAMKLLLADVDRGLIDVVVVYKVDRLTRSLSDFSKIVDRFDAKSVSFVSVTQAFNTTSSMGRLTLNMLLSFAQFEREVTGERIRDKIAASKAKGMWMGGRPPLGYDGVDRKLQINRSEADKVQAIFQRYLELGSVVRLTRELGETAVRSKTWIGKSGQPLGGHPFSRGAVYHLLANPVYRGAIRHGKTLYWGAHLPIIDEPTWDAVQKGLAENAPALPKTPKVGDGALLKGILFDDLGNAMQPIHTRRGDRRYHYYVTSARVHGDARDVGSLPRVGASTLDAVVIDRTRMSLRRDWRLGEPIEDRVRASLRTVTLGSAKIVLLVLAGACRPDVENAVQVDGDLIEIALSIRVKHRQSAILITPDDQRLVRPLSPDRALVRAVCLAREWRRLLEAGEVVTTRELARREGLCHRHTGRLLPLAYLAPDLVATILDGRQPRSMTLQALTAKPLPRVWEDQQRLFASFS
jgi:DNA invertase Pin-like site-specific DNA recombinase